MILASTSKKCASSRMYYDDDELKFEWIEWKRRKKWAISTILM